ncbi:TetR/AcrR family transcriptional regulator [Desulfoprunum benzoelyticum]|uniref:AcrR family transcriptional regulator n=1 Tax=Desulfoprunum benzoelyticum TaxID=1506996 RepID=A0A840V2S2_9BACT|nr:TetR/AcrR family transcriptional regulator [Desulfoprunum benzoelyticum]MBB5347441.1 AcrR family transcriptional regulator [Desulfoprunum benzoelyticum]MBM9529680.1 TetR/AcrR family transcriptional regulator [Desulfoprunum benzoelyticum]
MTKEITDKRSAILKAAMELIAENGFHGAPTAMIAVRAGVGTGTIYRYFADKDVLIREVHRELEERMNPILMVRNAAERSLKERFQHFFFGLMRFLLDNPLEFKFLEQFYNSPYGVAMRRDKILNQKASDQRCDTVKNLFEQGIAEGMIKDLPLPILFALFFGTLASVARDHTLGFIELNDDLIYRTAEASWDAIKR